jgi:hypothetical protein
MPGYKAHIAGAVVFAGGGLAGASWLGVYHAQPREMAVLGCLAVLGALFPDVDTNSKGRHLYYGAALVVDAALILMQRHRLAAVLGLCALLPAIGAHRGWTHTWWAGLIIPSPVLLAPMVFLQTTWQVLLPFYLAAVLGYFSHLFLDGVF